MEASIDNFLGGRIKIYQPIRGYRAGIDAVLLASFINAYDNCKILDVGSGTGLITFCIAYRYKKICITGIEKNKNYYNLSLKSLKVNKFKSKIRFVVFIIT